MTLVRTIGGDTGRASGSSLGVIVDVLFARDGSIWVIDGSNAKGLPTRVKIRKFDSSGNLLGHVGAEGDGPGEYHTPYGLAELPDGRIAVRDNSWPEKILVYREDGSHETTWSLPAYVRWKVGRGQAINVDTSGLIWVPFSGRPGPEREQSSFAFLRFRSTGEIVDEVSAPKVPDVARNSSSATTVTPSGAVRSVSLSAPYQAHGVWAWAPAGRFAVARTDFYRIEFQAPRIASDNAPPAETAASVTRQVPVVEIGRDERTSLRAELERESARLKGAAGIPIPDIPTRKPPIRHLTYSEDGVLMVLVSSPSERQGTAWIEPTALEMFAPEGKFVGRIELPRDFEVVSARGNRVVGIFRDPDGLEVVQIYEFEMRRDTVAGNRARAALLLASPRPSPP